MASGTALAAPARPDTADGVFKAVEIVRRHVAASEANGVVSLSGLLEAFERETLEDALRRARGNRARAARLLATTERIFNYRVRRLGIDWRRFKPRRPDETVGD
jgi:transcriptional regulator with GAF, ATPase, and Fis domain